MIKIAGIVEESYTDGVGIRYTIFTQGCSHNCFKCHNPETHDFCKGSLLDNDKVLRDLLENPLLDGVTFSGGDPMYQAKDCTELAKEIKEKTNLNIWCYTGFKYEDLVSHSDMVGFLKYIDVLVDGEYVDGLRKLDERFRGSTNQRIIDVQKTLSTGDIAVLNL